MDFGSHPFTREHLTSYARAAVRLGFTTLAANDHMVFSVPWLDGPTALAAVSGEWQNVRLATTVALPVIRGPVPLAKTLGAIDRLSGGKLTVAVWARLVTARLRRRRSRLRRALGATRRGDPSAP